MPEWDSTAEIHPDNPYFNQLPTLARTYKLYSQKDKEKFFAVLPFCRSVREAERFNKLTVGLGTHWLHDRPDLIAEIGTRFIQRFQLDAQEIVDLSFSQIRARIADASAKDAAVIVGIIMDKVKLAHEMSTGQEVPLEQLHPAKQLEHTEALIKLLEEKKRRLLAAQDAIPVTSTDSTDMTPSSHDLSTSAPLAVRSRGNVPYSSRHAGNQHLKGEHIRSDSSEQQAPSAPLAVRSRSQLPLEHHSHASPPTVQTGDRKSVV